jgi:protocatechuate 3,4-dioxygenase beta subunit
LQEFILLSDVIGLSLLVDAIDHPKPADATEGIVLGPFHTENAPDIANGKDVRSDPDGTPLLVYCTVKDRSGKPVSGMKVDVWETDSHGFYDVQYQDRDGPHGRAVLHTDVEGTFWFKGIVPVSYPVPVDGPVGDLLRAMGRHPYRPAHVHFMFEKPGFDHYSTYAVETLAVSLMFSANRYLIAGL